MSLTQPFVLYFAVPWANSYRTAYSDKWIQWSVVGVGACQDIHPTPSPFLVCSYITPSAAEGRTLQENACRLYRPNCAGVFLFFFFLPAAEAAFISFAAAAAAT
jgi:hypothetical protein